MVTTWDVQVWPWLDAALYSLLPFILLSQLNIQIVLRLWSARRLRRKYLVEGTAAGHHDDTLIGLREPAAPSAITTEAHWRDSYNGLHEQCWVSCHNCLYPHRTFYVCVPFILITEFFRISTA